MALLITAAILFLIANANPIVTLEAEGIRNTTTMLGAVQALMNQDMPIVSLLVLFTAVLAPAIEISVMLYLLISLRGGRIPSGIHILFRIVHAIKHWNMVEVFMLALLVALVKLSKFADVVPAMALWAYALFTILLAAAWTSFDPHDIWKYTEVAGDEESIS
jgi:paraquat-inducible protein A